MKGSLCLSSDNHGCCVSKHTLHCIELRLLRCVPCVRMLMQVGDAVYIERNPSLESLGTLANTMKTVRGCGLHC